MTQRNQVKASTGDGAVLALVAMLGGAGCVAVAWISAHAAAALRGQPAPPANPVELTVGLLSGKQPWTGTATAVAAALATAFALLAGLVLWLMWRSSKRKMRPDRAARYMARGKDIRHLRAAGARAKAQRLGVTAPTPAPPVIPGTPAAKKAAKATKRPTPVSPGVPFGRTVPGRSPLFASWEDMLILIAGPRTLKTTAYSIPACLAAPGACLFTSNKRDGVDDTRAVRAMYGKVFVFDPQQVANEPASWWWNPLTYIAAVDFATGRVRRDPVTGHVVADEARAEKLAGQFAASARDPEAKRDAYFDSEAENLVGLLLLAAACGELPITTVYSWLTLASDDTPVNLLRDNGFVLQEQSLYALSQLPDKQRQGVYGSATAFMGFLRQRSLMQWVTPPADATRPQFHPAQFARSSDTLYPLSKEGEGSAGPLVAALTVAVVDALEEYATSCPNGRLPVPFLGLLDEAANICKFRRLDSYYSHFGSRGIIFFTFLQNWAQGEEVWGVRGMEKLWSAANVKIYGGGVDDDRYLRRLSDLIGSYEYVATSQSVTKGVRTQSRSVQEKTILTVSDLRELPQGRAVAFASGTPAMLIEPVRWFEGTDADAIKSARQNDQGEASAPAPATAPAPSVPVAASPWSVLAPNTASTPASAAASPWNVPALDE